MKNQV